MYGSHKNNNRNNNCTTKHDVGMRPLTNLSTLSRACERQFYSLSIFYLVVHKTLKRLLDVLAAKFSVWCSTALSKLSGCETWKIMPGTLLESLKQKKERTNPGKIKAGIQRIYFSGNPCFPNICAPMSGSSYQTKAGPVSSLSGIGGGEGIKCTGLKMTDTGCWWKTNDFRWLVFYCL